MWIIPRSITSRYAPEAADLTSDSDKLCQMLSAGAMWRSKPLPSRSWSRILKTVPWMKRLSTTIYDDSTGDAIVDAWMESWAATPANRSLLRAGDVAQTTPDTFGPISTDSFANPNPDGASSRTSQDTLALDTTMSSNRTLKALATASRRASSRRRKSAHPTVGNDCSFSQADQAQNWATPVASDDGDKVTVASHQSGLIGQAFRFGRQAPRTPTPGPESSPSGPVSPQQLRLNPAFVEWLMGWPEGWVGVTSWPFSETASFRPRPLSPLPHLQNDSCDSGCELPR